jgi:hypothetical protein
MNNRDQRNIAKIYEEGFWDRFKASASGISGGVKGMMSGQGYAKSAQASKLSSLMRGKLTNILSDIQKLESDMSKYSNDPNAKSISDKVTNIKNLISKFTK